MAAFNKFNQFVEDLAKGVHNFTSDATCTVTIALCAAANAPIAGNSILGDLTTVSYSNLSSRVITGVTAEQSSGTTTFTSDDLVLTASGTVATFRYVVLYNDDPTSPVDPLIGWYDYGSNVTLTNSGDTFTLDFTTGFATLL